MLIALVGLFLLYAWYVQREHQKRLEEWERENPRTAEMYRKLRSGDPLDATGEVAPATPAPTAAAPVAEAPRIVRPAASSLHEVFARSTVEGEEILQEVRTERTRLIFSSQGGRLISARLLDHAEIYPAQRFLEIYRGQRRGAAQAHIGRLLELAAEQESRLRQMGPRSALHPGNPAAYRQLAETGVELVGEDQRPLGLTLPSGIDDAGLAYRFSLSQDGQGRQRLTMTAPLDDATVVKQLTFLPGGFECDVLVRIETVPGLDLPELPLTLDWHGGIGRAFPEEKAYYHRAIYAVEGSHKETPVQSVAGEEGKRGVPYTVPGSVKWAGVDSRYFVAAFIPRSESPGVAFSTRRPTVAPEVVRANVHLLLPFNDPPVRGGREQELRFYLGPKEYDSLKAAGDKVGLEDSLYGGFTGPICILMLWVLNLLHKLWPNYGVAILLLTVLVRLAMFPLVHKQTQAMKRMQKLQPLIKDIQARHKDNPQQAQREQLELMRKHKANPMAGCLPLLATLPIFIALWYTTQNTIGLRGEPFSFWVRDLSAPDTLFYLPFQVPFFGGLFDINPLPLAGAILMAWQMAQTSMAPNQKPMLILMPIMMLLITWRLPSGTNLYFMMSSVFQMGQQWLINRVEKDEPVETPAAAPEAAPEAPARPRPAREKPKRTGRAKIRK